MKKALVQVWSQEDGVLTFEWILLITVLVIGIVGGLSAVRDAIITELGDVVEAVISLDQSYLVIDPWEIRVPDCEADGASGSSYQDSAGMSQGRLGNCDQGCFLEQDQDFGDCSPFIERPF